MKRKINIAYLLLTVMIVFIAVLIPQSHSQPQFSSQKYVPGKNDSIVADSLHKLAQRELLIDSVITFGKQFLGLKYKYGGSTPQGFDCSGYVSYIYGKYGLKLPHSSAAIGTLGNKIDIHQAEKGDVMLFKGRSTKSNRVGHVALIIQADSGQITLMHSACQSGVVIEKYNTSHYYTSRYLMCRRVNL